MREKVCDFVYLDTKTYISLSSLKMFYWGIFIIPFIIIVIGIAGKSLFALISIVAWSLLYWIFVLILQSNYIKKTFELRFLVNGIMGLFVSSLFWILYVSVNIVSDIPFLETDFFLCMLFFYLLFTITYISIIVLGVYKGIYGKIKEKSQSKIAIMLTGFFAEILPGAGVYGMYTSRLLRAHASVSVQSIVATVGFVLLIFLLGLGHINFIQYYYCKKYGITCDENGDSTSPRLECKPKKVKGRAKDARKKYPLVLKILIGIACLSMVIFGVFLRIFYLN